MLASILNDATGVFVAGFTAVAVWLALCGSIPMIMMKVPWSGDVEDRGRHADFETRCNGNHASVEPDRSQPSTGRAHPG
jgi:hypothetical protein